MALSPNGSSPRHRAFHPSQRPPCLPSSPKPCPPDHFGTIAAWTTRFTGGRWGFLLALLLVVIWAVSGPFFHYSADWQLVINTGTTIVTFLMVFLIQNAQNRESKAIHLKLDELILAVQRANNELIDVEHLTEAQLEEIAQFYSQVARRSRTSSVDAVVEPCAEPAGAQMEG